MNTKVRSDFYFPSIDLLRALAVTMVVIYHIVEIGSWKQFPTSWPISYFRIGWLGVDLFFVISGFVITLNVISMLSSEHTKYVSTFIKNRVARIVPLYILTSSVFLVLFSSIYFNRPAHAWSMDLFLHAIFLHNLFPSTAGTLNDVTWSLGLEVQFYAFAVMMIPFLLKIGAIGTLTILTLAAWLYRFLITCILVPGVADTQLQVIFTSFQLPGALDQFSMGMASAILFHQKRELLLKIRTLPMLRLMLIISSAAVFMTSIFIIERNIPYWSNIWMIIFWRTLVSIAFLLLLLSATSADLPAILQPIAYIGKISYGIYLWHPIVLRLIISETGIREVNLLLLTWIITLCLAAVSWHFFELPVMQWMRRRATISRRSGGISSI